MILHYLFHASIFRMLGLQAYSTMPSLYVANDRTQSFVHIRQNTLPAKLHLNLFEFLNFETPSH